MIPPPCIPFPLRSNLSDNSCMSSRVRLVPAKESQPMTQRPHLSPPISQEEVRPRQIQPSLVWMTLTGEQHAMVLQVLVTMCQECLVPQEEVNHDQPTPLSENHACPS